ncbi:PTS galactitol transporter subunit IIC [Lachnospiraceae bacterium ZAX-1]
MDTILRITHYITDDLGTMVILPLFLIIIGSIFKMKFLKALRSGLLVVIGLKGIGLMIGFMSEAMQPAIAGMVESIGLSFQITDVGFPTIGSAAWSSPIAPVIIPLCIIINAVLLQFKWTKTLNIDIWNMFHFILAGAVTYVLTGNFIAALVVAAIFCVIALKAADWEAPYWQKQFNLPGTTVAVIPCIPNAFLAFGLNKLIDRIPKVRDIEWDATKTKHLHFIGDPIFLGLIIGAAFAALARLPFATILNTGVSLAAVMLLLPRMASLLMEGLAPITQSASSFMKSRYGGTREINIALDVACGVGDPTVVAISTICIPIYILLAIILPGNLWFPIVSLTGICYNVVQSVEMSKGNFFRSLVTFIIYLILHCYVITFLAPAVTSMVQWAGMELPAGALYVGGGNPENALLALLTFILNLFGFKS